jgi:hypothetical protein
MHLTKRNVLDETDASVTGWQAGAMFASIVLLMAAWFYLAIALLEGWPLADWILGKIMTYSDWLCSLRI